MSILIKNMTMPTKKYGAVLIIYPDGKCAAEDGAILQAVELPPHGRLIDVDEADDYAYDELELAHTYITSYEAARAMQKIYQAMPTIIEAEGE